MTYRILVTGTRNQLNDSQKFRTWQQVINVASKLDVTTELVIAHGACPTGVDAFVDAMSGDVMADIERHPADWYTHNQNCYHAPRPGGKCPAAGPRRNKLMVDLGADICLAFPMGESKGTRGCIKLAQDAGIPTVVTEL